MSSKKGKWKFRLEHILDAAGRIQNYTHNMSYEGFLGDDKTLAAVAWYCTVMGEAARQIPAEVVAAHPEVPWAEMRGMRNMIVHGYDAINPEIIWDTVQNDLPEMIPLLKNILEQEEENL